MLPKKLKSCKKIAELINVSLIQIQMPSHNVDKVDQDEKVPCPNGQGTRKIIQR